MTVTDQAGALYRFYDAAGTLLYVGITTRLHLRPGEHADAQPWWREVARMDVEHFASRPLAQAAEQVAIDTEAPRYNQARSIGKTPLRSFRIPDDIYRAAQAAAHQSGESVTDVVRRALEEYGNL